MAWLLEGFGSWGVYLFFLLSSFLLADRFWHPMTGRDLAAFYARRMFRIAPAYYVMLFLMLLFFSQPALLQSTTGWHQILANLTFTQWLTPDTASNLNVNGVLWTLTLEVLLYLTLPVLSWLVGRWAVRSAVVLLAAGVAYRLWVSHWAGGLFDLYFGSSQPISPNARLYVQRQYPGILPIFALGVTARWVVSRGPLRSWVAKPLPVGNFWPVLAALIPSLLWLKGIYRASQPTHTVWFVGFDLVLAVMFVVPIWLAVKASRADRLGLVPRVGNWLGLRSYSIYLWHFPIILAVVGAGPSASPARTDHLSLRIAIIGALTLLFGAASYSLVEKPGIERGRRLVGSIMRGAKAATVEAPGHV